MPGDTTPPSLLIRVRNADDDHAWTEFEARYRDLITRYCARRGVNGADADDVQQIVWLNLARGMRNFEYDPKRGRFRSYLGRVVQNAISRHFARPESGKTALDGSVLLNRPDDRENANGVWEQEWENHHYRLAMQTIERTHERRSVQIFHELVHGSTVADVASSFNTTEEAVRKVRQRIRRRMQALIAQQIREEDEPDSVMTKADSPMELDEVG